MKILLIGSGGREHALAWKIKQSPLVKKLYCAPGNSGIAKVCNLISILPEEHEKIINFCKKETIDLVVIGPEVPLISGLTDQLRKENILVFGPSQKAAQLEGSKFFTKELCKNFNIPTAEYASFEDPVCAKKYLIGKTYPQVIKADGLAAGKGVTIANTEQEAFDAIDACFGGTFGEAGNRVIIEEFLQGTELSYFCLCNQENVMPIGSAQDHKRLEDFDIGPNTGGMGAYSPAPFLTKTIEEEILQKIISPTLKAMVKMNMPFSGTLFAGLMITEAGPKLIEYNVRFGDPETQILMLRLDEDIVPFFLKVAKNETITQPIKLKDNCAITVVLAAKGYPYAPVKGGVIEGITEAENDPQVTIFHAGTKEENGKILANGGRVLNISATAETLELARDKAYSAIKKIHWKDAIYRKDIALKAIK